MEPIQLTTQEFFLYTILANAIIGFAIGLIPLAVGFFKGQRKYAFFGLIACVVGGALLGLLLSVPTAVFFVLMIFRAAKAKPDKTDTVSGMPAS